MTRLRGKSQVTLLHTEVSFSKFVPQCKTQRRRNSGRKFQTEPLFRAILTMDGRDQFPVDMVEQMLKFTPSPEERALLDEHADEIDHLARADRFLFELSK